MYKSAAVHLKNKYPNGTIVHNDDSLQAFDGQGKLRVHLVRDGNGIWVDRWSEDFTLDKFSLEPIAKKHRAFKLDAKGQTLRDEKFSERSAQAKADAIDGRIPSAAESLLRSLGRTPNESEINQALAVEASPAAPAPVVAPAPAPASVS